MFIGEEPVPVTSFVGHHNKITSLCFSPHISGQLVSVSYDCTAQVSSSKPIFYSIGTILIV